MSRAPTHPARPTKDHAGLIAASTHLYDIDRIISRTIAYGLVTAVLFAVSPL